MTESVRSLLIDRSDITAARIEATPLGSLLPGETLIRIDRVGVTANNVTYAAIAHLIPYFEFFPSGVEGFGRLPVWGFGDVVDTASDQLAKGERLFGIWPSSTHVVVRPERRGRGVVVDDSPHRRPLPALYADYTPVVEDPMYAADLEDAMCVLRPLFMTAFSIDEWLGAEQFMGAARVVLSSASSKTAWATAHRLHDRGGLRIVGLTSATNVPFVQGLGAYDRVLAYADVAELGDDMATAFIDFAGSSDVRRAVRAASGSRLVVDLSVGLSHWSDFAVSSEWSEPPVTPYFAPTTVRNRMDEIGAGAYMALAGEAWAGFVPSALDGIEFDEEHGMEALRDRYADAVAGAIPPDRGIIIRPG